MLNNYFSNNSYSLLDVRFAALWIVCVALGWSLLSLAATAQTPATTVTNSSGEVVLQSNEDGGLLAPGEFATGAIPAEGAGTRLMWYPEEAAFRAGRVGVNLDGTQWDTTNVGSNSVAFGMDTEASGSGAMAVGIQTTASSFGATAVGDNTTADGTGAMAMGSSTTASSVGATAMGQNTTASGISTTAMGSGTTASGDRSTAMGRSSTAATKNSLSIGRYNNTNTSSDGTLFVVGNGGFNNRSDALVLDDQGNLEISGTLTESSDRRLKTDIELLEEGALQALVNLRPVRYQFKDQDTHPSGEQIGLIAQEVRESFPELVREGPGGTLALAYPKLTAVLVKGMQEQQAQIDSLSRVALSLQEVKQNQEQLAEQVAALQQADRSARSPALPAGWSLTALLVLLVGAGGVAAGRRL